VPGFVLERYNPNVSLETKNIGALVPWDLGWLLADRLFVASLRGVRDWAEKFLVERLRLLIPPSPLDVLFLLREPYVRFAPFVVVNDFVNTHFLAGIGVNLHPQEAAFA